MERNYAETTISILDMVATERGRQENLKSQGKFAYTCADTEMTHAEAQTVLCEEVGEVAHEVNEGIGPDRNIDKRRLLKELIEVAAVAVAWAEKTLLEIEVTTLKVSNPPLFNKGDQVQVKPNGITFYVSEVSPNHGGINKHRYWGKGSDGIQLGAYEEELQRL